MKTLLAILEWLLPVIASCVITTLFGFWIKHILTKGVKEKELKEAIKKAEENELKKYREQDEKEKALTELRGVIIEELEPINEKLDKLADKIDKEGEGTVTLLRDRMKSSLNNCKKQGFATTTDKANWKEMYKSYKNLGGNHFREYVDEWKSEMEDLPIK